MNKLIIYTDGACSGNPGPGGWGAVILQDNKLLKDIYGTAINTTNNRMELTAVIEALSYIQNPSEIDVHTDSSYVEQGISNWIHNWKKNGWKTANNSLVKNKELWQDLESAQKKHHVSWFWVKGHSTNQYNIKADKLACKGRDEAMCLVK